MPVTKSAKKAFKRSVFLKEKNLVIKNAMKASIKKFKKSMTSLTDLNDGNVQELKKSYVEAQKFIDKADKMNIIHKNNASRKKSKLSISLNKKLNNSK